MTFDAPTRESCVVRRGITNTPLQALVLWNDVQFVEAARVLASRVRAGNADDDDALRDLCVRCTGRAPDAGDLDRLRGALAAFRARYAEQPADADALLAVGEAPSPTEDAADLAAWTMIAGAVLSLHETITQD
jgi:hypothetical protein